MKYNEVSFEVSGPRAMFTDPEAGGNGSKVSYPIPTYEAMRGVMNSIYSKPTITWIIDEVRVMEPIETETELINPISPRPAKKENMTEYTFLTNCRYQVKAHFIWNMNRPELEQDRKASKHYHIAMRSIEKGGRMDVRLGVRICPATVKPCVFGSGAGYYDETPEIDFGYMYHGITYADQAYSEETKGKLSIRYWHAKMENGVIRYARPWECVHRAVCAMEVKPLAKQAALAASGQ